MLLWIYIIWIYAEDLVSNAFTCVITCLIHWGWVTHICDIKLTTIGSDYGLSPGWRQAIIWTNAGILLIWTSGTNFGEILSEIHAFSLKKMHLKMSSMKWHSSCLGLNVLILTSQTTTISYALPQQKKRKKSWWQCIDATMICYTWYKYVWYNELKTWISKKKIPAKTNQKKSMHILLHHTYHNTWLVNTFRALFLLKVLCEIESDPFVYAVCVYFQVLVIIISIIFIYRLISSNGLMGILPLIIYGI